MANEREIINKLIKGDIKLHEIEKYTENIDEAITIRRKFAEEISGYRA